MPARQLPVKPNLEHLRNESREFQQLARSGDADAVADLHEHHPRRTGDASSLTLTDAQLVVARRYGFASWDRLRRYLDEVALYARMPGDVLPDDESDPVSRFLRLACITYGGDDRARYAEARALLARDPGVATSSIFAMAAAGESSAVEVVLRADPAAARREGGPHRWEPLLYAAYSRVETVENARDERSTLAIARVLLRAGADPNAGYLWDGHYPFTALTGAFGGGEDRVNQPPHRDAPAFARLLLESGADPNDTQALYNRMFEPDSEHLVLLFEYGLGRSTIGPWADRLGPMATPISTALAMDLQWAAEHGFLERVRLLLEHGVGPDADSGHPGFGGALPYELAERGGNREVAELLLASGATPKQLDDAARLEAACLRGDRAEAIALVTADPSLVERTQAERAPLQRAAGRDRLEAVRLMVELGFDVNARRRTTALHEAATTGNLELVRALVELGADPTIRDESFDAPALGWARHFGEDEVAAYLETLTPMDA